MSNYDNLKCPVPFKIDGICQGDKDDGRFTGDDESELIGLSGLEQFLGVERLINSCVKISLPYRTINGWVIENDVHKYKHSCGMYVYANKMTKGSNTVYIIDEAEYPDCGPTYLSVFSDIEAGLKAFASDFNIKSKVKNNTYVEQTV